VLYGPTTVKARAFSGRSAGRHGHAIPTRDLRNRR